MRVVVIALLAIALPTLTTAQSRRQPPAKDEAPTLPSIGLPLPQIGLPLPSLGLPPAPDAKRTSPPPRSDHRGGDRRGGRSRPAIVYIGPPYGWNGYAGTAAQQSPPAPAPAPESPGTGTVQLDVLPADSAEVYVDGYYVGTPEDSNGALTLEAGTHTLEIRAPGYETVTVDLRVDAGRTMRYRATLTRPEPKSSTAPAARADDTAPPPRKPVYIVPGCYIGNVPPGDAGLPPSCDLSRTQIVKPELR